MPHPQSRAKLLRMQPLLPAPMGVTGRPPAWAVWEPSQDLALSIRVIWKGGKIKDWEDGERG